MTVCRTCLAAVSRYRSLFDALEGDDLPLHEMVVAICSFQIEKGDGLPSNICNKCCREVKEAYVFKKKCEKSDDILRKNLARDDDNLFMKLEENCLYLESIDTCTYNSEEVIVKKEIDADLLNCILEEGVNEKADIERISSIKEICFVQDDNINDPISINFDTVNIMKSESQIELNSCIINEIEQIDVDIPEVNNTKTPVENNVLSKESENNSLIDLDTYNTLNNTKRKMKPISNNLKSLKKCHSYKISKRKKKIDRSFDKCEDEIDNIINKHKRSLFRQCSFCDFKTKFPSKLKLHMHTHTGEKPLACDSCSFRCIQPSSLQNHKLIHTNEKPYSCCFCDYKCSNSSSLKIHMRRHTNEKPYSCNICSYRFTQSSHLKVHLKVHSGEKSFLCDECHYTCRSESNLGIHKRNKHSQEKKFSCDECDFKTKAKSTLMIHKKNHAGIKNFSCDSCSYKSIQLVALENHKRMVHTGERPFACDQCAYRCVNATYLKVHKQTHLTVKMFSCDECPYTCHTKFKLKSHKRIHTGEKPYECNECDFKCASSSSLRRHHQRRHILE